MRECHGCSNTEDLTVVHLASRNVEYCDACLGKMARARLERETAPIKFVTNEDDPPLDTVGGWS